MIRFFFREDPESMDDETWASRVNDALWLSSKIIPKVMSHALWGNGSKL
jgi:hypothetical protein